MVLAFLGYGETADAGLWPIPTEFAMHASDMETGRLLCDDESWGPSRRSAEKTQTGHGVVGLADSGLDTRLHIRQEDDVPQQLDAVDQSGDLKATGIHSNSAARLPE